MIAMVETNKASYTKSLSELISRLRCPIFPFFTRKGMRKNLTEFKGQKKKKGLQQMQEDDRHDGGFGSERPTARA